VASLIQDSIKNGQGALTDSGALAIQTGKFTGRSPKDRYIVKDDITATSVDWGDINIPISIESYDDLENKIKAFAQSCSEVYLTDAYACASRKYRINIEVYTQFPWQNLFAYNMFLRPDGESIKELETDQWTIYAFPSVLANPKEHGTRQENFSIIIPFTL